MNNNSKSPRVCIVGAGLSGLCMASQLKSQLGIHTIKIYDMGRDVGGTWNANRYPGIACDVPGYLYSFSFFPKYDWSSLFSPGEEFHRYTQDMVDHFELTDNLYLEHSVQRCQWQPQRGQWLVTVQNLRNQTISAEHFDFIINATGKNRLPFIPQEFLPFKGPVLHSITWDPSISLENRRVGVVGTGASAAQIVAALPTQVKELVVFQRTPPHILPRPQFPISAKFMWALEHIPGLYNFMRYTIFWLYELLYVSMKQDSMANRLMGKLTRWWRHFQLQDKPELISPSCPNYMFGCKRVILSCDYYPALTAPNVELVTERIEKVEGSCLITADRRKHPLDVLVLATGFQSDQFFSPLKIIGKEDVDLLKLWKLERPRAYMGIMAEEAPNLFTILGPYTSVGHNSNTFNIECQVEWVVKAIKLALEKNAQVVSIRKEAVDHFMDFVDEGFKSKVWGGGSCTSWYLDGQQRNVMLWTHSQIEFWRWCHNVKESLFKFSEYSNAFDS